MRAEKDRVSAGGAIRPHLPDLLAMNIEDRFSVCEFSTMTASFAVDLEACRLGGVRGIGVCEAKLPAGGDAGALEQFRASRLKASVCLPAVLSILPLPLFPGPEDPEQRVAALIAGIRRLAAFRPAACFCLTGPQGEIEARRARAIVVDGLRRVARAAAEVGVPLGVEPIHASLRNEWTMVSTIPETLELITEVGEPNLGIGFDTWHLWDTPDLFEHIRRHARRIIGVHLSDRRNPTRGWADRVLPGDGTLDLAGMLGALETAGYDGWYDLEVLSDNGMFGNNYADSLWNVPPDQLVSRAAAAFQRLCAPVRCPSSAAT
jgi:sugar phosphate isomerase/epimerase